MQLYETALDHAEGRYEGTVPLQVINGRLTLLLDPDGAEDSDGGPRLEVDDLGDLLALATAALHAYLHGSARGLRGTTVNPDAHGPHGAVAQRRELVDVTGHAVALLDVWVDRLAAPPA